MFAMNLCLLAASREAQQHDGLNVNKTRTAIDISKLMGEMLKGLNIRYIYLHLKSIENGRNSIPLEKSHMLVSQYQWTALKTSMQ